MSDKNDLFIDGIGVLGQYNTYTDKLFSHGVIYFLRDYALSRLNDNAPPDTVALITSLNSKIKIYEEQCH